MGGYQRHECSENINQNQEKLSTMDLKSWDLLPTWIITVTGATKSGGNGFSGFCVNWN